MEATTYYLGFGIQGQRDLVSRLVMGINRTTI